MKLWHVGFEVRDLDAAIKLWESKGYALKIRFEKDQPNAEAAMMVGGNGVGVELWMFRSESSMNKYIADHIGFKVDNAQQTAADLEADGYKIVIPYTEGLQANYMFLEDEFGKYIEVAEEKKGA